MENTTKLSSIEQQKFALYLRLGTYIGIGVLNSVYLSLMARGNCIYPSGIFWLWCETGGGLAHAIAIIAWPAFWL